MTGGGSKPGKLRRPWRAARANMQPQGTYAVEPRPTALAEARTQGRRGFCRGPYIGKAARAMTALMPRRYSPELCRSSSERTSVQEPTSAAAAFVTTPLASLVVPLHVVFELKQ